MGRRGDGDVELPAPDRAEGTGTAEPAARRCRSACRVNRPSPSARTWLGQRSRPRRAPPRRGRRPSPLPPASARARYRSATSPTPLSPTTSAAGTASTPSASWGCARPTPSRHRRRREPATSRSPTPRTSWSSRMRRAPAPSSPGASGPRGRKRGPRRARVERPRPLGGAGRGRCEALLAPEGLAGDAGARSRARRRRAWLGPGCAPPSSGVELRPEVPFVLALGGSVVRGKMDLLARGPGGERRSCRLQDRRARRAAPPRSPTATRPSAASTRSPPRGADGQRPVRAVYLFLESAGRPVEQDFDAGRARRGPWRLERADRRASAAASSS